MWLFTQYGFYSVVCARDPAGNPTHIDRDTFMVRARPAGISSRSRRDSRNWPAWPALPQRTRTTAFGWWWRSPREA